MESRIPIATDNIYKFYALFGLFVFISSFVTFTYVYTYYYELSYKNAMELEVLNAKTDLSQEENIRKKILEARMKIDVSNKYAYTAILCAVGALGVLGIIYGFTQWHSKVQPKQDMLLDLQIEKLKHEINALNRN